MKNRFTRLWLTSYFHPRAIMDELTGLDSPRLGALYVLARGAMLSLLFYLPFHLLGFTPITPAYLPALDSPDYFLYAALMWPLFGLLSWVYLQGVAYLILRVLGYRANFDQMLNLGGLLTLTIGVTILVFDWLMVAFNLHNNAVFLGLAHTIIADPWFIALTAIFYRKQFGVPTWLTIMLGIATRLLYMPLAILFIRT